MVHNEHEAYDIEEHIKACQLPSQVVFVEKLILGECRSPHEDKKPRLKSESENEVPECRKPQVLHKFTPERVMEMSGEVKEAPDDVNSH